MREDLQQVLVIKDKNSKVSKEGGEEWAELHSQCLYCTQSIMNHDSAVTGISKECTLIFPA